MRLQATMLERQPAELPLWDAYVDKQPQCNEIELFSFGMIFDNHLH